MGTAVTKLEEPDSSSDSSEGNVPSTPILTPKVKNLNWDPRSPSASIVRTPIEAVLSEQYEEQATTIETAVATMGICSDLDPRSPSVEFTRTPIVIEGPPPAKFVNKNLEIVRKQLAGETLKIQSTEETMFEQVPPKLLESSPITTKIPTLKRRTTGLLETNFDFVETDLDEVIQNKSRVEIESSQRGELQTANVSVPDSKVAVKDFDKKLSNLIYEDTNCDVVSPISKVKEGNRTPLGDRNARDHVLKLKVNSQPTKLDFATSKIPVIRAKVHKNKGQCENACLPNNRTIKARRSQWDADKSIVI